MSNLIQAKLSNLLKVCLLKMILLSQKFDLVGSDCSDSSVKSLASYFVVNNVFKA